MKQALLIIDVQNDYFEHGKMPLVNVATALNNIHKLQCQFRQRNNPIFYIQHIKMDHNADFFAINSDGAKIHPSLLPMNIKKEKIIVKHYPNSFKATNLEDELIKENVTQLIICGMMTHMCIDSTTRQAAELGYQPILIADACATKDLTYKSKTVTANDVQAAFMAALANFSFVLNYENYIMNL